MALPRIAARKPQLGLIVDESGTPIKRRMDTANYAAETYSAELAGWQPPYMSADTEWLPERELALARVHEQVRNNGMINGAMQTQLDNWVGAGLRLAAKPDWVALGVKDADAQSEWEDDVESKFLQWGGDLDCYCDAGRQLTFGGIIAQACRTFLMNFEVLATAEWMTRKGAKYSTAIQMIDPMRLSNPNNQQDTTLLRGGILFDTMGAPERYFIASRLPSDFMSVDKALIEWKEVPRETPWGRRVVIHIFEQERPGQSRGKGGLVSVLARGRMLDRNERAHLQAAIQNAIFASFVTSPMDWQYVAAAMGSQDGDGLVENYLADRLEFHRDQLVRFGDTRMPHLYPGEEIKHIQASHPHANFDSFERIFHRYMAAGMGLTYEQFSKDYSQTNYSGHRAALLDYWRFVTGRRVAVPGKLASLIYALWLEEAMDKGEVKTPAGAPSFLDAKAAWCGAEWIGPGRGQIDPLKEANAAAAEDKSGWTNDEIECAERGRDWRQVYRQRAQEARYRQQVAKEYGVKPEDIKAGLAPAPSPFAKPGEKPGDGEEEGDDAPAGDGAKPAAPKGVPA